MMTTYLAGGRLPNAEKPARVCFNGKPTVVTCVEDLT
jgi:hypothetical protein